MKKSNEWWRNSSKFPKYIDIIKENVSEQRWVKGQRECVT
jgi:hypothetical protein